MSYALKYAASKLADELKEAGIKIEERQNIVVTDKKAIRIDPLISLSSAESFLKRLIRKAKDEAIERQKRKQTTLFEEDR